MQNRITDALAIILALQLAVFAFSCGGGGEDPEPDPNQQTEYGGPDDPATPENETYIRELNQEEKDAIEEIENQ